MSWNEEQAAPVVRRALTRTPVPPSRLDVGTVLRAGRRAERRRRQLTVGLAAVAVLAVGLGSTALLGRDGHDRGLGRVTGGPPEILPAPTVVPVTVRLGTSPAPCTYEQFEQPTEVHMPSVSVAERTGRFMAGTGSALNWRTEKSRTYLVIWDRGKPSVTDLSRSYVARVNAVNSAGVAVGTRWDGVNRPEAAWVYRDGQVRNLAMPSGHRQVTPVAINERGDILGMAGRYEADSRALVVWPAGSDESPRVVEEQVRGEILDWAEDGTLTERVILGSGADVSRAVRVSRPDGSAVVMTAPDGWGMGIARPVRGAWIAGTVPGTGGERTVPALWNTSTNQVFVYHGLDAHHQNTVTVDTSGRLLARKPGDGWYLVEQDGTARPLPLPPGTIRDYGMGPLVIDDEGVIQGKVDGPSGEGLPTAWRCR